MRFKNESDDNSRTHYSIIRKTRSKIRRTKFLSLRLELISPENSQNLTPMTLNKQIHGGRHQPRPPQPQTQPQQHQQLNLFPLHPENMVEDRDENNVAFIFDNDVGNSCSLHSFLPTVSSEEDSFNFDGGVGGVGRCDETDANYSLVRTAMRSRERETIEEKWVYYSEVVEKTEAPDLAEELEVTSSAAAVAADDEWLKKKQSIRKHLSLKLDYEGILNAWSDKSPLYLKGESPQTVPNLQDDQIQNFANMEMGWKVPEMEGCKMGKREASVLRYKEKRQNRLFSKRIRYEVRKLNAEKRPRMKGRFVKRS